MDSTSAEAACQTSIAASKQCVVTDLVGDAGRRLFEASTTHLAIDAPPPPRTTTTTRSVMLGVVTTTTFESRRAALKVFRASAPLTIPLLVACVHSLDAGCNVSCGGINECRNTIAKHALKLGYEYVAMSDDDVILPPGAIQKLHAGLVQHPAIDVLAACFQDDCYAHRFSWESGRAVALQSAVVDDALQIVHVTQNTFVARTAKLGAAPFDPRILMHEHEANFLGLYSQGVVVAVLPSVRVAHLPTPPSDLAYAAARHVEAAQLKFTCTNFAGSMRSLTTDSYVLDCVQHTVSLPYQSLVGVPLEWSADEDDEGYYTSRSPEPQILILIPAAKRTERNALRVGWLSRLPDAQVIDYLFVVGKASGRAEQRADTLYLPSKEGYGELGHLLADAFEWVVKNAQVPSFVLTRRRYLCVARPSRRGAPKKSRAVRRPRRSRASSHPRT